jgi:hypothetical protein
VCRDYLEFPMHWQQRLGAPFKPYFGLSGIPQHSTCYVSLYENFPAQNQNFPPGVTSLGIL